MRTTTYYVLLSLAAGPLHGYGIAKRSEELSHGEVRPTAGSLYGTLDRLAGEGLITLHHQEPVDGRTRRYYAITDTGRQAVLAEVERMRAAVDVADGFSDDFRGLAVPG